MKCDKNKVKFGVVVFVVLSAMLAFVGCASATTWYVDDSGGYNFTKIQDAINNASEGDTIFVFNGTYNENLNINKYNLTIIGEDKTNTTIDGSGNTCVYISGKQKSISGFTMQNGEYGIHIYETGFHKINNNIIKLNSKDGIYLMHSSKTEISDNIVKNNKGNGIYLQWSSNNKVIRNEVRYNDGQGIYLEDIREGVPCNDNEIEDNIVKYNKGKGIYVRSYHTGWYSGQCNGNKLINNTLSYNSGDGITFTNGNVDNNEITKNKITFNGGHGIYMGEEANENSLKQNEISDNGGTGLFIENPRNYISQDNLVNGKTIYHFYKVYGTEANPVIVENKDLTEPYIINWAKVSVIDSYCVIIRNCTLSNSDRGVYIDGSRFVYVVNNKVKDNPAGIELYNSDFCKINDNNVTLNDGHGIFLSESPNNEIINNSISGNKKDGIHLTGDKSQDNKLEKNKIDGNGGTGLVLNNPRNYISQDNVVNGEHIYWFYKVAGTEDNPIIVDNLSLTKPAVINYAKISVIDSYHIIIRNCTVSYSERGIYICSSKSCKVENNSANYNTYGIDVSDSSFIEAIGNDACHNSYGIYMYDGSSNKINENKASFNSKDGMFLQSSSKNEINDNIVENNKGNGIYLQWSSNNKVIRNEVRYNDGQGIYLEDISAGVPCNDNEIEDNIVKYNKGKGIYVRSYHTGWYSGQCNGNKLINNTLSYNSGDGITFTNGNVDNNEITKNKITFNGGHGIYMGEEANENSLKQNEISDNGGTGLFIENPRNYISQDNTVNGERIYWFYKEGGIVTIENLTLTKPDIINWAEVGVIDSNYITIKNCSLSNSDRGIYIDNSKFIRAEGNDIKENKKGIEMLKTENCMIINNKISSNEGHGILLTESSNAEITENTISLNNDHGLYLDKSNNNLFYHNNFINNPKQAYDAGTNTWNKSYPIGGNYWSDHTCHGNPSNGSEPYQIDADSIDHYPFQNANGWSGDVTPPEITSFAPPSPVIDTICSWRAFNVTVNQTVNVSWYLNGALQQTNETVQEASCRLHATVSGEYNVTAIASNPNGTDMQTWIWNVTEAPQGNDWGVKLGVTSGAGTDVAEFGLNVDATDGFDAEFDVPEPPSPPSPYQQAYLYYPENTLIKKLSTSYIPHHYVDGAEWNSWPFRVDYSGDASDVAITWNATDIAAVPQNYSLFFVVDGEQVDMRTTPSYTFSATTGTYEFEIIAVTVVPCTFECSAGWNMISFPVEPLDKDADTIFGPDYHYLCTWDSDTGCYVPVDVVETEIGYWLLVLEDRSVTVLGTQLTEYNTDLAQGWNMIGSIWEQTNVPDGTETVPADQMYPYIYAWCGDHYALTQDIEPGLGYWALAYIDCELHVFPAPPAAPLPVQQITWGDNDWHARLAITSGVGTDVAEFGLHEDATDDFSAELDVPEPPSPPPSSTSPYQQAYFYNPEDPVVKKLSRCYIPHHFVDDDDDDEYNSWLFRVDYSGDASDVTVTWNAEDINAVPAEYSLLFIADDEQIDMRTTPSYTFRAKTGTYEFEIRAITGGKKPDLVIEDSYEKGKAGRYTVLFVVKNIGTATAPGGHYVTLYVDGVEKDKKLVPKDLEPGETYESSFKTKVGLTGKVENIKVCADSYNDVDELDEANNCLKGRWQPVVEKPTTDRPPTDKPPHQEAKLVIGEK